MLNLLHSTSLSSDLAIGFPGGRVGARPPDSLMSESKILLDHNCPFVREQLQTYYIGERMLKPEGTLRQLVEQLHVRVQKQEAELADFEVRAQKYLSALTEEISRNRKRIELFRREMEAMENENALDDPLKSPPSHITVTSPRVAAEPHVPESQSERIRELARDMLAKSDRPLMQSEIKTRLEELGVQIVAKNVAELVRAALRRHPSEFLHIKGEGWTLVSQNAQGKISNSRSN